MAGWSNCWYRKSLINFNDEFKINELKINEPKNNELKINEFKINEFKINEFKINKFKLINLKYVWLLILIINSDYKLSPVAEDICSRTRSLS